MCNLHYVISKQNSNFHIKNSVYYISREKLNVLRYIISHCKLIRFRCIYEDFVCDHLSSSFKVVYHVSHS
jgi:hypothetical protein